MRIADRVNRDFRIVLASASPRRKQIMELVGMEFEVWPSQKEEVITGTDPADICMELSRQKALDVASSIQTYNDTHTELTTQTDILVIGADTIVAKDGKIFGKPADEAEAKNMLMSLSGDTHSVFTGVSLVFISRDGRVGEHTFCEETKVSFFEADDAELDAYIATADVYDKAGAYGIQSGAAAFVKGIDGDYYNVMGLPVARMLRELKRICSY